LRRSLSVKVTKNTNKLVKGVQGIVDGIIDTHRTPGLRIDVRRGSFRAFQALAIGAGAGTKVLEGCSLAFFSRSQYGTSLPGTGMRKAFGILATGASPTAT